MQNHNSSILLPSSMLAMDIREIKNKNSHAELIRLCSNEAAVANINVIDLLKNKLNEIHQYPDADSFDLKEKIAKKLNINNNQITLSNGSTEILSLVAKYFLVVNSSSIISEFGYPLYEMLIKKIGGKIIKVPMINWQYNLNGFLEVIEKGTKIIFLTNPNNPTGSWLKYDDLDNFIREIPKNIIIVIDEAYYEYFEQIENYESAVNLIKKYQNLIVTRTFSKAYGLAGLRIGFSISSSDIAINLNNLKHSLYINSLALYAASLAINDEKYLKKVIDSVNTGREFITNNLKKLGLNFISSNTNYILIDLKTEALPIYKKLLSYNILVQPMGFYNLPNYIRVTISSKDNNSKFISSISKILYSEHMNRR